MRKRLFDGKMPLPLRIVAWLFIADGVFSIAVSLIQTSAIVSGFGVFGVSSVATGVANAIVTSAVGAGILFRRRLWRACAAILVGSSFGLQLADLFFYPQIITLISLGVSGFVLWALTERRAHLAMRG